MNPQVYWEGLGLRNVYSGIGRYAQHVQEALLSQGIAPCVLGGRFSNRVYQSKVFHPVLSRFEMGVQLPKNALVHGLANTNTIPWLPRSCPQVLTLHDMIPLLPNSGLSRASRCIFQWSLKSALKRADLILVPSHATYQDVLERAPHTEGRVRVLPYGFPQARVTERHHHEPPMVLMVSRWEAYKGFETLSHVVRACPGLRFCLVTDERGKQWASDKAFGARLEVLTHVSEASLEKLYARSSVVLHPSYYEGFGLPIAEGLASGRPVVFRAGTAAEEFAPQSLQMSFEHDDAAADLLQRFSREDHTQALRQWLSGPVMTWEAYGAELAVVYRDMIS